MPLLGGGGASDMPSDTELLQRLRLLTKHHFEQMAEAVEMLRGMFIDVASQAQFKTSSFLRPHSSSSLSLFVL